MEQDELEKQTERLLRSQYKKEVAALRNYKSTSFIIDYKTITNNLLAKLAVTKKQLADRVILDSLRNVGVEETILKPLVIRYINLPITPIRSLKSEYVSQTRSFDGIVRRVSEVKSKVTLAVFECSFCTSRQQLEQGDSISLPESKCEICGRVAKWKIVPDVGKYIDYQTIVVQEFPETIVGGDQPKSITVVFTSELCDTVIPGNRVNICGTLKLKKVKSDTGLIFEPYVDGNSVSILDETYDSITVTDEDLLQFKLISERPHLIDTFAASIAPTVYGHIEVKKGLVLQLLGGVPKNISGSRIRGDIHVLLIGDPGIAKSVIMKYAVGLLPRGVFTQGYSASGAGLTAAAIKVEDQWVLEAGALVLASGGICGVDELDKMGGEDREALHGAMEQQEINVAKAGIVAKLYTRCSLLAAANPKLGRFDMSASLSSQFNLAPTLLSRFDLIYPMTDTPEATRDGAIADYILSTHSTQSVTESIPIETLRKYIGHARTINPRLTKDSIVIIKEYYTKVRGMANNMDTVPITARSLEALIRLSEAAARLRLSEVVTADDATLAMSLIDGCLRQIAYDSKTRTWDIDRVMSGYTKRNRNVMDKITDTIISTADEHGVASSKAIATHMKEQYGIAEDEVLSTIELMKTATKIYYPREGYIKLMKS